jgi:predicted transcriptional regulator
MAIRPQLRNILNIIADLTYSNVVASISDIAVIQRSRLPALEVNNYLNELESSGLINLQIKVSGADFRLLNITKEGLMELSDQNLR